MTLKRNKRRHTKYHNIVLANRFYNLNYSLKIYFHSDSSLSQSLSLRLLSDDANVVLLFSLVYPTAKIYSNFSLENWIHNYYSYVKKFSN